MEQAVPRHIGFILDGNRRWAVANNSPTLDGHKKGYENIKMIAKAAFDQGVEVVSAYIFSTENWKRTEEEVSYLMELAMWIFKNELKSFEEEEIKIVFLGTLDRLSGSLQKAIQQTEARTRHFTRGTLALCFNYGGRGEIVEAVKSIIRKGVTEESVSEDTVRDNLYAPETPDVDLLIRTSGESRISNFMLWRVAYSELIFCSEYWPDYTEDSLRRDILEYNNRQRRFGE